MKSKSTLPAGTQPNPIANDYQLSVFLKAELDLRLAKLNNGEFALKTWKDVKKTLNKT